MNAARRIKTLEHPRHLPDVDELMRLIRQDAPLDLVIDSDTGNETDDQFACAYALMCPDRFRVHALTAAPFLHYRVLTAAEGEFCSHLEQRRILSYFPNCRTALWRGSWQFLSEAHGNASQPLPEGVEKLLALSRKFTSRRPLFYVGIATLTNLALALQTDPTLVRRVVLVWLGGQAYYRSPEEFNLLQDVSAAQVVLNSSIRQIVFPCEKIADALTLNKLQASDLLAHRGVGDFLYHRFIRHLTWSYGEHPEPSTALSLYDLVPFAFLSDPALVSMECFQRFQLKTNPLRRDGLLPYFDLVATGLDREGIFRMFREHLLRQPEILPPDF